MKTECKRGHPFDEANTYIRPGDGARMCRACQAIHRHAFNHRHPARALASRKAWKDANPERSREIQREAHARWRMRQRERKRREAREGHVGVVSPEAEAARMDDSVRSRPVIAAVTRGDIDYLSSGAWGAA